MKVFFSYAREDKGAVEQVFERVASEFPEVEGWLDTYEIVAGNDLIEKMAEGIDYSGKTMLWY
jgi:hypothetical protein